MRESEIQAAILSYLQLRGDVFVWRNNSGAFAPRPGAFLQFGSPGSADLLGVIAPSGRLIAIEVKAAKGRVSAKQERWGEAVRRCGGLYVIARSVDDVRAALGEPVVRVLPTSSRVFHGAVDD